MKNVSKSSAYIVGETKAEAGETGPSRRLNIRHEFLWRVQQERFTTAFNCGRVIYICTV